MYDAHIIEDILRFIGGEQLSWGQDREVFEYGLDATKVVKIETSDRSFQNIVEWHTWNDLKDTRYAKYLAPCHSISPGGRVLVMSRVEVCSPGTTVRLPEFLTDLKACNFGRLAGSIVACDYGLSNLLHHSAHGSRLRKITLSAED